MRQAGDGRILVLVERVVFLGPDRAQQFQRRRDGLEADRIGGSSRSMSEK